MDLVVPKRRLYRPDLEQILRYGIRGGAGNYPDVPSYRMPYDRDGTVMFYILSGVVTQYSSINLTNCNDENASTSTTAIGNKVGFIFPQLRDLAGYFIVGGRIQGNVETSVDTTNGLDGTWVSQGTAVQGSGVVPNYRTSIQSLAVAGIKAVRFETDGNQNYAYFNTIHLYGTIHSGETRYLAVWNPSSDVEIGAAAFDWGNTPRGSSADKTLRVKNLHSTLRANSITLSLEALTDTTPSVPGQYLLSTNGTDFYSSVNIGDLAAGAISGVVTARRTTPSDAVLSVWTCRMNSVASSWS